MLQTFKERSGGAISHRVPPTTLLEKAMFEPREPLTFRIRTTPRPGVRLERDLLPGYTDHASSIPHSSRTIKAPSFATCQWRTTAFLPPPDVYIRPAPHEVVQDVAAKPTTPSRMSQPNTSQGSGGDSLQAGNPPSERKSTSTSSSRGEEGDQKSGGSVSSGSNQRGMVAFVHPLIAAVHTDSPLQIADLYIHQNDRESVRQIWMWTGHRWDVADPECTHPIMSEYRLKILGKGEPSWVTRKTMVSDQGRAKRKLES
ncbi:hypothetical protein BKA83DRAFT_4128011 [Pisolithus microcarpus]|nr:hypothetical protein BKA83DRAFT_4128011 [Pisolithus microcarpus]